MFHYFCRARKNSNMNKRLLRTRKTLRFRRWSRKAYSVLISLTNHVTVGHVSKSISDASCRKSSMISLLQPNRNIPFDSRFLSENEEDEDSTHLYGFENNLSLDVCSTGNGCCGKSFSSKRNNTIILILVGLIMMIFSSYDDQPFYYIHI